MTNIHAAHAATKLFGGAQPRREAFVVVREEDGLGILENRKNKEKHTKNGGQTGVGVLPVNAHVTITWIFSEVSASR